MSEKCSRRTFLGATAAGVAAATCDPTAFRTSARDARAMAATIDYINPDAPNAQLPEYCGSRATVWTPATLDLADRAKLAVNVLTESVDRAYDNEMYWIVDLLCDPPAMYHTVDDHVQAKFLVALPLCRTASGSVQNLDVERDLMRTLLKMQGPDGLIYLPITGRPWALPPKPNAWAGLDFMPTGDHWSSLVMSGMHLGALCIYATMEPNGPWAEAANRLVDGLKRVTLIEGESAYLFLNCTEPGKEVVAPDEPPTGIRAAVNGWVAYGLVQAHRLLQREDALDLAHRMMRYVMLESGYFGPNGEFMEDGPGVIHFHAHTRQIDSALAVVACVDDEELRGRAVQAYEYACRKGNTTVGFFPEWVNEGVPRPSSSEICEVADMITAALKLCRLGLDKWDDVDRWTRNQFAECQLVHTNWLTDGHLVPVDRAVQPLPAAGCDRGVHGTTDRVAERMVGAFSGWPSANDWVQGKGWSVMHCCTGNGTRTIYQVWRDILQWEEGHLRINLLLNRASPWVDMDSHVPYAGRVDVHVKRNLSLSIRLPEWVDPEQAECRVNGELRRLTFQGRYAGVGKVRENDAVVFEFPLRERSEKLKIEGRRYTVTLRGNDVVYIDPQGATCPLYQKGHFRTGTTLWKRTARWVPDKVIAWL